MIDGDLTYFLTVASTGTLARAAEQLGFVKAGSARVKLEVVK